MNKRNPAIIGCLDFGFYDKDEICEEWYSNMEYCLYFHSILGKDRGFPNYFWHVFVF